MRISDWGSDVCSSDLRGYRKVRRALARQYDIGWQEPDIQVVDVDMAGDRHLILEHNVMTGVLLAERDAAQVLQHLADLWSYDVCLTEVARAPGRVLNELRHKQRHQEIVRASHREGEGQEV